MYSRRVIYTDCRRLADWTVTVTLTATLILTVKKRKGKCFNSNLCLRRILKWTIFSCAGDRLALKMSLYVEL